MLKEEIHQPEKLPIEEISSPLSAEILQFCEAELFSETITNSEDTSSPKCGYEEKPIIINLSLSQDTASIYQENHANNSNNTKAISTSTTASSTTTTTTTNTTNNINGYTSTIFDPQEDIDNDISASIDFTPSPSFSVPQFLNSQQEQFDFPSAAQPQIPLTNVVEGLANYTTEPVAPIITPPFAAVFEEECLSSVPPFAPLTPSSPSCAFLPPPHIGQYMLGNATAALSGDGSGIFPGNLPLSTELPTQELDYHADNNGIYCPDSMPRVFNLGNIQAFCNESQELVNGHSSSTPLVAEISNLDESTYRVGRLSMEQRKEKIHRYMKKRNERNFSKKIKYACRKTLADSRPRVRGRFAKNDDFGENRLPGSSHEEDDKDEVAVKEDDDMLDSSDIFSHISGVNSFKCNYPIQSWI